MLEKGIQEASGPVKNQGLVDDDDPCGPLLVINLLVLAFASEYRKESYTGNGKLAKLSYINHSDGGCDVRKGGNMLLPIAELEVVWLVLLIARDDAIGDIDGCGIASSLDFALLMGCFAGVDDSPSANFLIGLIVPGFFLCRFNFPVSMKSRTSFLDRKRRFESGSM